MSKIPKTRIAVVHFSDGRIQYYPQKRVWGMWWNIVDGDDSYRNSRIRAEVVIDLYISKIKTRNNQPEDYIIEYPEEIRPGD